MQIGLMRCYFAEKTWEHVERDDATGQVRKHDGANPHDQAPIVQRSRHDRQNI